MDRVLARLPADAVRRSVLLSCQQVHAISWCEGVAIMLVVEASRFGGPEVLAAAAIAEAAAGRIGAVIGQTFPLARAADAHAAIEARATIAKTLLLA